MTVSEIERTELAAHLVNAIGKEPTETLMKGLLLEGKDRLATKDDLKILGTELRAEIAELRAEVRGEIAELRGEIAELRAEVRGEIAELRGEMVALRGHVELALSKHARLYFVITAGFMLTIWGTLLALFVT